MNIHPLKQPVLFILLLALFSGCHKEQPASNQTPALSIKSTASVSAGSTAYITVTLSAAATSAVKVNFSTAAGTATSGVNFVTTSDTLVFSAGQTTQNILVATYLDPADTSGSATFTVTLANVTGATLGNATSTVTINFGPMPGVNSGTYYIVGTVSGKTWYQSGLESLTAYYNDYPYYIAGTGGEWLGSSQNETASVTMELYTQAAPDANSFYAMLTPGSYGYATASNQSGVVITFLDNSGVTWSSYGGDQTGSTFAITGLQTVQAGAFQTVFSGKFSCKLYNPSSNVITMTNGYFNSEAGLTY